MVTPFPLLLLGLGVDTKMAAVAIGFFFSTFVLSLNLNTNNFFFCRMKKVKVNIQKNVFFKFREPYKRLKKFLLRQLPFLCQCVDLIFGWRCINKILFKKNASMYEEDIYENRLYALPYSTLRSSIHCVTDGHFEHDVNKT